MKISTMIEELSRLLAKHGDLEVTCTASAIPEMTHYGEPVNHHYLADVYESTAENLLVCENETFGKHVRVYL